MSTERKRSPTPPPIRRPEVIRQLPAAKKIKTDEDKKPDSPASLEIVMGEIIEECHLPQPPRPPTPNPESPENLPLRRSKRLEAIARTSPSSASTSSSSGIASSISSPVSPSSAASSTSSTPSPQGGGRPLRTYYNRRRGMRSGATSGTGDSDENPPPDVQQVVPGGCPGQQGQNGKDATPASTKGPKPS